LSFETSIEMLVAERRLEFSLTNGWFVTELATETAAEVVACTTLVMFSAQGIGRAPGLHLAP
jgi:hypothetical protein